MKKSNVKAAAMNNKKNQFTNKSTKEGRAQMNTEFRSLSNAWNYFADHWHLFAEQAEQAGITECPRPGYVKRILNDRTFGKSGKYYVKENAFVVKDKDGNWVEKQNFTPSWCLSVVLKAAAVVWNECKQSARQTAKELKAGRKAGRK